MMKALRIILVLGLCAALFAGCGTPSPSPSAAAPTAAPAATSAAAAPATAAPDPATDADTTDRTGWPEKITIVQMPDESNPNAGTKNAAFRAAMQEFLGIEVEELQGSEYAVGIEAMKAGNLEILMVTPMSYFQAKTLAGVEPLVKATTMGADPYKTVFVTQADNDEINSLEDLRGKTFAFVDPASSSGYMFPKAELVTKLQLDPDQLEQPGYFFETVTYSGQHDSSLMGVIMGDYEAAAVAYQLIGQLHEAGMIDRNDIKIVGETGIIPDACYVVRPDLPQNLKDKLLEFYLGYDDPEYFEMFYSDPEAHFIRATEEDYAIVDEMTKILKIETGE